jgi:cytosine/adenosine deaminase-related metal-dependent hydrolase
VTAAPQAGAACVLVAGVIHVPRDPFAEGAGALEAWDEGAIAIAADGRIDDVGDASEVRSRHPDRPVVDRRGAIALPGFVDATSTTRNSA